MSDKTVTRSDLADATNHEVGLSHHESSKLVDDTLNEIANAINDEGRVVISSFGSFNVRQKQERMGRNPKTGEEAVISARRTIVFKPAHKLKHQVATRVE